MANSFLSKIYPLMHFWWITWSNHRWKDVERHNQEIDKELFGYKQLGIKTYLDVDILTNNVYKKFEWTRDGVDQLFDSICPPPYNYVRYKTGVLKDDCDGYHALMYHILHANGIECYLMSVADWLWGHCILLFKLDNKWYTMDYTTIHKGFENVEDSIKEYDEDYAKRCRRKYLDTNGFVEYDYEKGIWKNKPRKELK